MKGEKKTEIWGPAITMKQINVHIPRKNIDEWEKLRDLFKSPRDQSIQLSPDGGLFMVTVTRKIAEILFPIARNLGLDPIDFTESRLDIFCDIFKGCVDENDIKDINKNRDKLVEKYDKRLKKTLVSIVK